ncbi:MAG: hypothetical protein V2J65_38375 [Desulfobacteraceae bacterium]|nr:hypothetical protein [Desulfobacteraceae bacterium]
MKSNEIILDKWVPFSAWGLVAGERQAGEGEIHRSDPDFDICIPAPPPVVAAHRIRRDGHRSAIVLPQGQRIRLAGLSYPVGYGANLRLSGASP